MERIAIRSSTFSKSGTFSTIVSSQTHSLLNVILNRCFNAFYFSTYAYVFIDSALQACRRNNKLEKRKRNRDYARKFQAKVK